MSNWMIALGIACFIAVVGPALSDDWESWRRHRLYGYSSKEALQKAREPKFRRWFPWWWKLYDRFGLAWELVFWIVTMAAGGTLLFIIF